MSCRPTGVSLAVWGGRVLLWWVLWQAGLRSWRKLWPRPRPPWLGHGLLDRLRPLLWPPDRLVARFGIERGAHVIEVGAGAGRLTEPLVRQVGGSGHVIAVDDRLDVVEDLQLAGLARGQTTLTVQHAPATLLPCEPGSVDVVVLTSVVGGEPKKDALLAEAYRVLRPGGRVAISEFVVDTDYCLASTVVTNLVLTGFAIEREVGGFAGYTVIGRKPGRPGDL